MYSISKMFHPLILVVVLKNKIRSRYLNYLLKGKLCQYQMLKRKGGKRKEMTNFFKKKLLFNIDLKISPVLENEL